MIKTAPDRFASRRAGAISYLIRARRARAIVFICALATLSLAAPSDPPLPGDPLRYRGGLRNSRERHRLSAKQLDAVLTSLRDTSGLLELHFDEEGFLTLGDRARVAGGSAAARALLIAAVESAASFVLESRHRSDSVAFARLGPSVIYESQLAKVRIEVFPLALDFSDFAQLRGEKEVIAAFDPGFAVLHELAHGVLGLRDAGAERDGLGTCENYINRIRRELGLPERQYYFARILRVATSGGSGPVGRAELTFVRAVEKQGRVKTQQFYLSWEAKSVGEMTVYPGPKASPAARSSTVAMQQ